MSKRMIAAALASSALLGPACAPVGVLYTGVKQPPQNQSLNETGGEGRHAVRTGEACAHGVLGLVAWGDASQGAAAAAGGFTEVETVDEKRFSILAIVYQRYCTVVSAK